MAAPLQKILLSPGVLEALATALRTPGKPAIPEQHLLPHVSGFLLTAANTSSDARQNPLFAEMAELLRDCSGPYGRSLRVLLSGVCDVSDNAGASAVRSSRET